MKLNVKDRIILSNILPVEGDFRTMKTIQQLRDALLFNEQEVKRFQVKTEAQQITWDASKPTEVEIAIGELATEVIVDRLRELDKEKKLSADHLPLWERFIETGKAN